MLSIAVFANFMNVCWLCCTVIALVQLLELAYVFLLSYFVFVSLCQCQCLPSLSLIFLSHFVCTFFSFCHLLCFMPFYYLYVIPSLPSILCLLLFVVFGMLTTNIVSCCLSLLLYFCSSCFPHYTVVLLMMFLSYLFYLFL